MYSNLYNTYIGIYTILNIFLNINLFELCRSEFCRSNLNYVASGEIIRKSYRKT